MMNASSLFWRYFFYLVPFIVFTVRIPIIHFLNFIYQFLNLSNLDSSVAQGNIEWIYFGYFAVLVNLKSK